MSNFLAEMWQLKSLFGLCALALTLAGCSRGVIETQVQEVPASERYLPRPAALPVTAPGRGARVTEADVLRNGEQFEAGLPNNLINVVAGSAIYAPANAGAVGGLEPAAYAVYSFNASGYDRDPVIHLDWSAAPTPGDLHIGLADFSQNRWRWFEPQPEMLDLGDLAAYVSASQQVFVVVLLSGDDSAILDSLRLGGVYPYPQLSADPLSGEVPLTVNFDASASSSPEGTLTLFEWDFEGDGVFDADSGASPLISHDYAAVGDFTPAVRVTNSLGNTAAASISITVTEVPPPPTEWLHTAGLSQNDYFQALALDAAGNTYVAGYTETDGGLNHILVARWSPEGELLWGRDWNIGAGYCESADIAVDSEENVIVCGYYNAANPFDGDDDAVLLKWTPDGALIWARRYNGPGNDYFNSLSVDGTDIFVAGSSDSLGSDFDALTLRLSADGNLVWTRRYNWYDEKACDSGLLFTSGGATALFVLTTQRIDQGATDDFFPHWMRYDLDGNFSYDASCNNDENIRANSLALSYDEQNDLTTLFISGIQVPIGGENIIVMATNNELASLFCQLWDGTNGSRPAVLAYDPLQGLLLSGNSDYRACLWRFSPLDGSVLAAERYENSNTDSELYAALWRDGAVFACGYAENNQGAWESVSAPQISMPRSWTTGLGLSGSENLSLVDPPDDAVVEWLNPVIDTGASAGFYDGLVVWRAAP